MSEQIRLSELVKYRLERYRDNKDHNSMDSVVREIMKDAGVDIYEYQDEFENEKDEDDEEYFKELDWDE